MANNRAATQDFVDITNVKDTVITQRNGKMISILLASSINFALKSLEEQRAILMQFQSFINTLDFTLQIYVQSRRLNIKPYLAKLSELETKQDNDLMRTQLREYIEFINAFTTDVSIMNKNFFVVVPYSPGAANLKSGVGSLFSGSTGGSADESRYTQNKNQLDQRVSLVSEGLARVGVKTVALQQDELVELFYHLYNLSDPTGKAPLFETEPNN